MTDAPARARESASPFDRLLKRLRLTQRSELVFEGGSGRGGATEANRLFGGLVLGQAVMAAARTVDQGSLHALQAQFLGPSQAGEPLHVEVESLKNGRQFSSRLVRVRQGDRIMLAALASFTTFTSKALAHQRPMPNVPAPEGQPNRDAVRGRSDWQTAPIDIRLCSDALPDPTQPHEPALRFWLRANGQVPTDEPQLHAALLAYATDRTLLGTAMLPHQGTEPRGVSLDHSVHLYRPADMSDWLLYDMDSPVAGYGRGLARGFLYRRDGTLVGVVQQEGTLHSAR
ncbi:MAG: acyl-CoA thioesterase domain-containing protein [Pseudomonadota bacterium]